jgi:Uma2 family endonuclease
MRCWFALAHRSAFILAYRRQKTPASAKPQDVGRDEHANAIALHHGTRLLGTAPVLAYVGQDERKEGCGVDRDELGLLSRYRAPRRLLTVDEYHRMGEVGILTEDDRVELIEGELVAMAPIGSEHVAATNALNRLLVLEVGARGIVSVQNPVRLTRRSEPQPDFAVLKPRDYRKTLPRPEDTMLAVEVANTSLDYDRTVKLALYARSGIPEVWIVNLTAEEVEVYRSPVGDGYTVVTRAGRSGTLTIGAIPDAVIPVADIFA